MTAPAVGDLASGFAVHIRETVSPRSPWRMGHLAGADGLWRRRGTALERLIHRGPDAVVIRAAETAQGVVLGAWSDREDAARWGVERLRFTLGLDDDLHDFHRRFADDPWIGRAIRADPGRRPRRTPDPFQALTWAITEQLIEYDRAAAIQRSLIARLGRRCARTALRDAPSAEAIAGTSQAQLQAAGLSAGRSRALIAAARDVVAGRVDLHAPDHERGWRRLRAIPGIGSWTIEMLAIGGQGRLDQVPALDLHLLDLAGRVLTGDPRARGDEAQVRDLFAPYAPYGTMAMLYASATPRHSHRGRRVRSPDRGGTHSSQTASRWAAA